MTFFDIIYPQFGYMSEHHHIIFNIISLFLSLFVLDFMCDIAFIIYIEPHFPFAPENQALFNYLGTHNERPHFFQILVKI